MNQVNRAQVQLRRVAPHAGEMLHRRPEMRVAVDPQARDAGDRVTARLGDAVLLSPLTERTGPSVIAPVSARRPQSSGGQGPARYRPAASMMSAVASGWDRNGEWLVSRRWTVEPARADSASCAKTGKIASRSVIT